MEQKRVQLPPDNRIDRFIRSNYQFDLKRVLVILHRYKYVILTLGVLVAIATGYKVYFMPDIYRATSTVEVQVKGWFSLSNRDPKANALTGEMVNNIYTEMEIIKSRFLIKKAIKSVDFSHRYYIKQGFLEKELYKESPVDVNLTKGFGRSFILIPIDKESFILKTNLPQMNKDTPNIYKKRHRYGERVKNIYFDLTVNRTNIPVKYKEYRFVVIDPAKIPAMLKGNVSVAPISRKATILGVSFSGTVPLRVQEFANELSKKYLQQSVERRTWEAIKTIELINKQLKKINLQLKSVVSKIEKFRKQTMIVNIDERVQRLSDKLAEYESELVMLELKSELIKSFLKRVNAGKRLESLTMAGIGIDDTTTADVLESLRKEILNYRDLLRDYTASHPTVKKSRDKINLLKDILTQAVNNILRGLEQKIEFLHGKVNDIKSELTSLPEAQRKYLALQRALKASEEFYAYLLEKRTEAEIRRASNMNLNRIVDTALLPQTPVAPKRHFYILAGFIIGLILGILYAILKEILDDRVKTEDEVKDLTTVPMLGTIPHFGHDYDEVTTLKKPKSVAAESFRNVRTNLSFMSTKSQGLIIAVTSTIQGEGKTLISANIGAVVAMSNKKTIVVSMDMRRPTIHRKFKVQNSIGMSNILSGHAKLSEIIQTTEYNNLDIITSGPIPPNPSELLGSPLLPKILEKLKEKYDVIVIDTPPIGPVTDGKLILPYCDIVAYVLRAGYSRKNFIESMEEIYLERDEKGLGFILNDFDLRKHGYGYAYGYEYRYKAKYGEYYETEKSSWLKRVFKKESK